MRHGLNFLLVLQHNQDTFHLRSWQQLFNVGRWRRCLLYCPKAVRDRLINKQRSFLSSSFYSVTLCTNVSRLLRGGKARSALTRCCFAGFGFQLGWEGELDGADAGTRKRAFNNEEWSPPGSPGKLQNGDQTLAVSHQDRWLCRFLSALCVWPSRTLSGS